MIREACLAGLLLVVAPAPSGGPSPGRAVRSAGDTAAELEAFLRRHGRAPADYVLAKLAEHRVVLAGEGHWQRRDVELVTGLLSELRRRGIALAVEFLRSDSQSDLDALLAAPEWDEAGAHRILRAADWPYAQYRDLLRVAWSANRLPGQPLQIIGLGPPRNWRESRLDYDAFMAERVATYLADPAHRLLVYCGMHHAFTRFLQVERMQGGRATEFMQRMGNLLWRRFGAEVFLVALHRPEPCGGWSDDAPTYCAPLGGAIDCAASRAGGAPVAFDILSSPVAEAKIEPPSFYALGHPLLRLVDLADGYVWQQPVDETELVDLVPLAEFSPEEATEETNRRQWDEMARDLAQPQRRRSWRDLSRWRTACRAQTG